MDCFSSSSSKKLIAITTMLLITATIAVTVSGESFCGLSGPVAYGACKDDYANCVTNVLTQLRDTTPYIENQVFTTYYPVDQPSGAVSGFAICLEQSDAIECQSCLSDGIDWFDQNCAGSAGSAYDGGICEMEYTQM